MIDWQSHSCGARWTEGRFTEDCPECGGGGMETPCVVCGGRCGSAFHRAPIDSNDSGLAHWNGACALLKTEQHEIMRAAAELEKERSPNRDETDG